MQAHVQQLFARKPALFLAPLARVTESSFRRICREFGADLTYTEMAVAKGIVENSPAMYRLLTFHPAERPIAVQITGHQPELVARAVRRICSSHKPTLVDLNAGCPVEKICSRGAGASLLENRTTLHSIISAAVNAAGDTPISLKIRLSLPGSRLSTVDVARLAEDCGVAFVSLHARTRADTYSLSADWDAIAEVKSKVAIPVVGNGDVFTARDAAAMYRHTECDAILIARGALGKPWLFRQIRNLFDTGHPCPAPGIEERFALFERHIRDCFVWMGEFPAIPFVRKHLCWYTRELNGSAQFQRKVLRATSQTEFTELLRSYQLELSDGMHDDSPADPITESLFRSRVAFWTLKENLEASG